MSISFFDTPASAALERGLDACSLRARLIANNIANADTPNYKAQRLSFEELLADKIGTQTPSGKLSLTRTDSRHFPGPGILNPQEIRSQMGDIFTDDSLTYRLDGNNVDMDHEMAEQSKNAIQYSTLTELISRKYSQLRSVITGGRQ
jgi:flagellar basal-body rod protein FlgB